MSDYFSRLPVELLTIICRKLSTTDIHSLMAAVPVQVAHTIQNFSFVNFDYSLWICMSDNRLAKMDCSNILELLVMWYNEEKQNFFDRTPSLKNVNIATQPTLPLVVLFELCQLFQNENINPHDVMPDAVNYITRFYLEYRTWDWSDEQDMMQKIKIMCLIFGVGKVLSQKKCNTHELGVVLPHLKAISKCHNNNDNLKLFDVTIKKFIFDDMAKELKYLLMRKIYNSDLMSKWNIKIDWTTLINKIVKIPNGCEDVYTNEDVELTHQVINLHSNSFIRQILTNAINTRRTGNAAIIILTTMLFIYEDDNLDTSFASQHLFPHNLYPKNNISKIFNVVTNFIDHFLLCYYNEITNY